MFRNARDTENIDIDNIDGSRAKRKPVSPVRIRNVCICTCSRIDPDIARRETQSSTIRFWITGRLSRVLLGLGFCSSLELGKLAALLTHSPKDPVLSLDQIPRSVKLGYTALVKNDQTIVINDRA